MVSFWKGGVAHWDDVERRHNELGHLSAHWRDLGRAAGTVRAGVKRIEIVPGKWSTPAHCELAEEEIFYVLGGSGLLWQDEQVHEVGAGDCMVFRAAEQVHTLRAGPDGLDVLAFGTRVSRAGRRAPSRGCRLARADLDRGRQGRGAVAARGRGRRAAGRRSSAAARQRRQHRRRAVRRGSVARRPQARRRRAGSRRPPAPRSRACTTRRCRPGGGARCPHCHSAEEEIFVVLEGEGTLELTPTPLAAERGATAEEHELRPGSVVSRPGGTKVAHSLVARSDGFTLPHLRHPRPERHRVLPALEQGLPPRRRPDRPGRAARVRRRRARRLRARLGALEQGADPGGGGHVALRFVHAQRPGPGAGPPPAPSGEPEDLGLVLEHASI